MQWGWWAPSGETTGLRRDDEHARPDQRHARLQLREQAGFAAYDALRVCSFRNQHPGGANFAMADGSVRFLKDSTAAPIFRTRGARAGGEAVSSDAY